MLLIHLIFTMFVTENAFENRKIVPIHVAVGAYAPFAFMFA